MGNELGILPNMGSELASFKFEAHVQKLLWGLVWFRFYPMIWVGLHTNKTWQVAVGAGRHVCV